ncbi:MAG TPA: TadE family type IV pilus minor pilin [Propionibacteriaceae bacterium]|nr:TadE family type IV pilus minor pilin [Propionibacteriaceae bacterium]
MDRLLHNGPPDIAWSRRRDSRGMVTAELAVSILAVLAVLTMLCWAIYLVVLQVRCVGTAGEVARQAARGDRAAVRRAEQNAPAGARVTVTSDKETTRAVVTINARPLTRWLVVVPLRAESEVATEPAVGDR